MPHDAAGITATAPLPASSLLGRTVLDASGQRVGRIVDLIVEADRQGRQRLKAAVVTDGPWGRLLGYERAAARGPWLIEVIAHRIMRRHLRRIPWNEVHLV